MNRSNAALIACIIAFRVFNAVSLSTFFQPDEYFQAFEPAHVKVYGYGQLTWEWKFGLRGCLVPMIYAFLFRFADLIGADLVLVCRVFQGIIAAVGDIYTYKLALRLENAKVAKYSLIASLCSSFYYYCGTRPFSNTFEMVFTSVALTYWPWHKFTYSQLALSSCIAHFAIMLRPTNATLWLFLGFHLLLRNPHHRPGIISMSALIALFMHAINYTLDNWYYGFSVWPLWSFIVTNIGDKVSHYYGVMPFHFYITQAIPMVLIGYLPLTVYGLYKKTIYSWIILSQVVIYSLLAHKEIRFILYLLPLMHIVFAKTLLTIGWRRAFIAFAAVNIVVGGYLSYVHQRGVISVTKYVQKSEHIRDITFLMPCHSIPGDAHFHRDAPLTVQVLGCDPPIVVPKELRQDYIDEADQFYADPVAFLETNPSKLTDHIAIFEALDPHIAGILEHHAYREEARFFNSHIHEDTRRKGDVIVYSRLLA